MLARGKPLWIFIGLIAVYVVNVGFNAFYKTATEEQMGLLRQRGKSIKRIDESSASVSQIEALMRRATFSSFTTFAPVAVQRRNKVTHYLRKHAHSTVGIAIDEAGPTVELVLGKLRQAQADIAPHGISIGLAEPFRKVAIPLVSSRSEAFHGATTAFGTEIDHHIVLTRKQCDYPQLKTDLSERSTNQVYSFGRRGLTIIDSVTVDETLAKTLALVVIDRLSEKTKARRWQKSDYDVDIPTLVGADPKRRGRTHVGPASQIIDKGPRNVSVTIGLDMVGQKSALRQIERVNQLYSEHSIRFDVRHMYVQSLDDGWRWPRIIAEMQDQSRSDIYLLLTARAWRPGTGKNVRGISSHLFGAALVQAGSDAQTTRRLAHELGHLFGLAHTFLAGHIMYPTESKIGLRWSPGSVRNLKENRHNTPWRFLKDYPTRMKVAARLAPPMVAGQGGRDLSERSKLHVDNNAWAICDDRPAR
ncbi:MAG: hypothetical protein ACR2OV_11855 [Hyphomicrobiaceae bacterium]